MKHIYIVLIILILVLAFNYKKIENFVSTVYPNSIIDENMEVTLNNTLKSIIEYINKKDNKEYNITEVEDYWTVQKDDYDYLYLNLMISEVNLHYQRRVRVITKLRLGKLISIEYHPLNSNLVINPEKVTKNVLGVDDSTLEYNNIGEVNNVSDDVGHVEKSIFRNPWPKFEFNSILGSEKQSLNDLFKWDSKGIPEIQKDNRKIELIPKDLPLYELPRNKGEYSWLFDKTREIPSFPTSNKF